MAIFASGAGASQTTTTGAVFRPNIWAKEVLGFVKSNLVLVNLVQHYDRDIEAAGQTVEIPNVSTITANAKAAGTAVTLNAPTETKTTITINKHWEASFLVEDILVAQSAYDLRQEYTQAAAYAIAEKIDNELARQMAGDGVFTGFSQAVGTFGTVLADSAILAAQKLLDDAKAPQSDRAIVVTPQGKQEILNIDKYIRYDAIGVGGSENSIKTGQIGEIYGMRVYMSQNLFIGSATPLQNKHLMFHKQACAVAIQKQPRVQAQYKLEYLSWLVVCDILYGLSVLRPTFGVLLRS